MVIKFETLRDHLKLQCLNKYDFTDYTKFCQSSYFALNFSKAVKKPLPIHLDNWIIKTLDELQTMAPILQEPVKIKFNQIIFKIRLTDEIYMSVLPFFKKRWSTDSLKFEKPVKCTPILFSKLVQLSKAKILSGSLKAEIPPLCLRQPAVQQLGDLQVFSPVTDEDIVELKTPRMFVRNSQVTAKGINNVLKQWFSFKRSIVDLNIMAYFPRQLDHELLAGIPLLDPSIFYEIMGDTIPKAGIFQLLSFSATSRFFGITKGGEHLLIDISSIRIWIKPVINFDEYLENLISPVLSL